MDVNSAFARTALLLGEEGMKKLKEARVAVFGIGGVGGYAVEALVRAGVGAIDLIDHDTVSITNINRQIIANVNTIGKRKIDVMEQRILSINPAIKIKTYDCFYLPETRELFDFKAYNYVVDAVDTVTAKIDLAVQCEAARTPLISSMGTGNKLDPASFEVADIYKTSVCPLAKVMRRELKQRGVRKLKVVYSKEPPLKPGKNAAADSGAKTVVGSISFVPPAAGLILAKEVVKDLLNIYDYPKP